MNGHVRKIGGKWHYVIEMAKVGANANVYKKAVGIQKQRHKKTKRGLKSL